jgi:glyceraldehyde 3-phosphate dehydrogenase
MATSASPTPIGFLLSEIGFGDAPTRAFVKEPQRCGQLLRETSARVADDITTVHDATNTQTIIDAPHKDLRRARAAGLSLIPTTTGSATAIGLIYPELLDKLNGHAIRVPLLTGSLTDCVFQVKRDTTAEEVNALLKAASETVPLKGILNFETRPLVSVDFKGNPASATIDALSTMVVNKRLVKIYAWYDNEWGYSNRMVELTRKVAASLLR